MTSAFDGLCSFVFSFIYFFSVRLLLFYFQAGPAQWAMSNVDGLFPSVSFLDGMGLGFKNHDEVAFLYSEVFDVMQGGPIPKRKVQNKVTCSNIMPFFHDHDQYNKK